MRDVHGWAGWETHVNTELGLTATAGSGNQWYEKGDGIDKSDSEWAYQVDAKFTDKASRSVSIKEFTQLAMQAAMQGKKFALPIRLWPRGKLQPVDLVVITFEDFVELVKIAKGAEQHA
jgi:hypothetical protein